jgi:hypothetical protein
MTGERTSGYLWVLLGALPAALVWACSSSPEAPGGWGELKGEAGGGGPGGAPPLTSSSSAGGDAGGDQGGAGGSGGAGGAACIDTGAGEPNDTEASAVYLGMITDEDRMGGAITGVLMNAADVDWYTYNGTDVSAGLVDPERVFDGNTMRVCKFAECIDGGPTDIICHDATSATSPSGRPGCCATQTFWMEVDCSTSDDDARIYIRVDQPTNDCTSYSITYHY